MAQLMPESKWSDAQRLAVQKLHARVISSCIDAAAHLSSQAAPLWMTPCSVTSANMRACARAPSAAEARATGQQRADLAAEMAALRVSEAEWQQTLNAAEAEAAALNPQAGAIPLLGDAESQATIDALSERIAQGKTSLQQYMGLVDAKSHIRATRAEQQQAKADGAQPLSALAKLKRFE